MHTRRLALLLVVLAAVAPRDAAASQELRDQLGMLSKAVMAATRNQPVSVGIFSPTGLPDTNSGQAIEEVLKEELRKISPESVSDSAKYIVKGDIAFAKSREPRFTGLKIIKIKARIIEKEFSDDLLQVPLEAIVDGTKTIAEILQPTVALDPDGTKEERNEDLAEAAEPEGRKVHVGGPQNSHVSTSAESTYAVEVLVKSADAAAPAEPRGAEVVDGQAFVDIALGELYEVRVHNTSEKEVAMALSIDGLDMFHFSKDRNDQDAPLYTHFIVPFKGQKLDDGSESDGTTTIVGWHNSVEGTENFLSFQVMALGQGAASKAELKARGNVGVIHVQFADCAPLPEGARARSGNETGFGPPREVKQTPVVYEIEPPHEFVSIRYQREEAK